MGKLKLANHIITIIIEAIVWNVIKVIRLVVVSTVSAVIKPIAILSILIAHASIGPLAVSVVFEVLISRDLNKNETIYIYSYTQTQ